MKKKYTCSQKGFSLTELSVALAIVAVIAGSAISVAITSDTSAKTVQTKAKLERIVEAIGGYAAFNKRIPCPANGTLAIEDTNFGLEGAPTASLCASSNFNDGSNVFAGVVPVRTLQLPDDYMFDGWGRRFTYSVDYRFANNTTTNPDCGTGIGNTTICFAEATATALSVRDSTGTERTSATDRAAFLVFSHGENGHGAFTKGGSSTRINVYATSTGNTHTFTDELENAHLSSSGTVSPAFNAIYVQKEAVNSEGGEYFDDIAAFQTKGQLIQQAGATLYESLCTKANTIVNNPGANDCTGATSESNCESFANTLAGLCIQ